MTWGESDFVQYYVAWELIFEAKNPYDPKLAGVRQLHYGRKDIIETYAPPWSLLPSLPLAALTLSQAIVANIIINILLLSFCAIIWNALLFQLRWQYIPFVLFGVCFWLGTLMVLGFGQISLWPLAGFTGWLWCCRRRYFFPAGLFLVLTIIKPHIGLLPGIFAGAYSLRQRHWSTVMAFALGLLGATATICWFRPTIWSEYFSSLQTGSPPTQFYTATLDGWLRLHVRESFRYLTWPLWVSALLFTAVSAWIIFNPKRAGSFSNCDLMEFEPLIAWFILSCMATVVFVPYAFQTDYVFMLPGYFLALGIWLRGRPKAGFAMAIWILLYAGSMWLYFTQQTMDHYWIIPWAGLGTTIWFLREQLVANKQSTSTRAN